MANNFEIQSISDSTNDLLIYNIRQLMQHVNISEAELARQTNIPQPTLHKILTGSTVDPRISTLRLLADFFNISVDDLYLLNLDIAKKGKVNTQSIPIISWNDCLKGSSYIDLLNPANWSNWLVTEPLDKNAYGLISKPSMEPHFPRNTILIISPTIMPMDGDFVVVHYEGTEEATLRELIIDGPTKLLVSLSTNTNQDILSDKTKILGVLIQSRFAHRD